MKALKEHFEGDELSSYLKSKTVDEGAIGDFFKKTWNYLKGKVAQIGDWFVSVIGEKILPVMLPITSQIALKKQPVGGVHWFGNSADKKFSGVSTSEESILSTRPSTLKVWQEAAKRKIVEAKESKSFNQILEVLKLASDDNQIRNVDGAELERLIEMVLKKGSEARPLLVWGAPGIGKTAIINAVLKRVKGEDSRMLDFQLSMKEHDDFFLPSYNVNKTKAVDLPKSYLPVWEDLDSMTDEERKAADEACGKGLIFLDELSRAKPQVQDVCLKLVDERKLGEKYKLGSGWSVIAASNRMEDDMDTQHDLSIALANRFRQVNYSPTCKSWRKWADKKGYMNKHVLDWLEQNEKYFYYQDNDETKIFCTPRAWEGACKALADMSYTADEEGFDLLALPDDVIMGEVQDYVGLTAARAFMDYVKLMRTIDMKKLKLVLTDPDKAPLPKKEGSTYKLDIIYIITTTIVSFLKTQPDPKTFENICTYYARMKDESAAGKMFSMVNQKFPAMGKGYGESDEPTWNADYKPALDILIAAYPEWENADFD